MRASQAPTKSARTGRTAMGNVSASKVVTALEALESLLPALIQEALGELVGAAGVGLAALSVGVGLRVVRPPPPGTAEAKATSITRATSSCVHLIRQRGRERLRPCRSHWTR